jgi:hypothetical protein
MLWSPGLLNSYHDGKKRSEGTDCYEMGWGMGGGGVRLQQKKLEQFQGLSYSQLFHFLFWLFLIYWVTALLYLTSAGSVTRNNCNNSCAAYDLTSLSISDNNCCGYSLHHSKNIAWAITYHVFGVFWTTQFINACCLTTIAGAIAAYYWARGKTSVSFCSTL